MEARWGVDDIWRIFWMTVIFGALMPLSRSAWVLRKNFSLAMVLHTALGAGFFVDSVRRKTHPHVWILNAPIVIWYILDKIWCATRGRFGELAHPFTTCSSHDVIVQDTPRWSPSHAHVARPMIEIPIRTDVSWPGHRFSLHSAVSNVSRDVAVSRSGSRIADFSRASSLRGLAEIDLVRTASSGSGGGRLMEEEKTRDWEEDTIIGAESTGRPGEVALIIGNVESCGMSTGDAGNTPTTLTGGEDAIATAASWLPGNDANQTCPLRLTGMSTATAVGGGKKMGLKRLETPVFQQYRNLAAQKSDREEGRAGGGGGRRVAEGGWNKMAIVRIHRRKEEPKTRECTCLGVTHVVSSFRRSETASIADVEAAKEGGGCVPLRTYGPYRSDYGRLAEFPDLPPLLIIATGAGAALALDFVAFVRANGLVAKRPVKVCYSSASLALLQFVTNTLLAKSTPGIHIKTALTRHDDLELFDTPTERKEDLAIGRLDVKDPHCLPNEARGSHGVYAVPIRGSNHGLVIEYNALID
eukprot:jgi/Undpi1/4412/HiC_scaffold_17.g07767.m1